MNNEESELLKVIDIIKKRVLPEKIILFGSRALNTASDQSDYDLFIIMDREESPRSIEKELYYSMAMEGIGIPVDLVVETQSSYERLKSNQYLIYHQVDKFGKTLYEKESTSSAVA